MPASLLAGLDLSLTSTGLVIVDARRSVVVLEERVRPRSKGMERLEEVAQAVCGLLEEHGVQDVAIEGYAMGKTTSHAHAQGELGGAVRLQLWRDGVPYIDVPPSVLKKVTTGKGNAPKDVMLREVFRRWGYVTDSNDLADAYALAKALEQHHWGWHRKADETAWTAQKKGRTVWDRVWPQEGRLAALEPLAPERTA